MAFSRALTGESMFQNVYTAQGGAGIIAFASSFPGAILAIPVSSNRTIGWHRNMQFLARKPV